MSLDTEVCYCFHITRRKLVNFMALQELKVASQLSECGGAGTGCGWCIPFLKQLFAQHRTGEEIEFDSLTAEEYAQRRAGYIRSGKGKPPDGATSLPEENDPADS